MSVHIALLDDSEIVQKMLSHCLHYFSAEVSRFDDLKSLQSHYADQSPDILFVDWEMQKAGRPLIDSVIETIKDIPVVLLYRANRLSESDKASIEKISHKIQKPLDPKLVRDMLTKLVSKLAKSNIHPFLQFPKGQTAPSANRVAHPSKPKPSPLLQEEQASSNLKSGETPKDQASSLSPQDLSSKAAGQASEAPAFGLSAKDQTRTGSKKPSIERNTASLQEKNIFSGKLNKEDLNIDETTHNDLAPMAIKSHVLSNEENFTAQDVNLSEKDILRVLNKYKDSLEFQKLMENFLSEYAQEALKHILQPKQTSSIAQASLKDFKDSKSFKDTVEREIAEYVRLNLPQTIKEIVESEIKKIIED